jgi:hypothetical protein
MLKNCLTWGCFIYCLCLKNYVFETDIYVKFKAQFVEASWNVMPHTQKPDFVFRRNGLVHLNPRGRQFSRLLVAEVSASAVVMLDTPCSEVVWRVLATHSICRFSLHFPSRASPCAITFQLDSTSAHPLCHHGSDRRGFTFYVLLDLLNDAVTSSECIASDSWMSIELGRMCKEAAVRWFEVHSQRLPGCTEERHKIPLK